MNSFYLFFSNNFLTFITAFMGGSYSVIVYLFLIKKQKKKKTNEDEFIKLMLDGLIHRGVVTSLNDIYNLYKGYFSYELENEAYRADINRILRRSIVILFSIPESQDYTIDDIKNNINVMLHENEKLSPYANLPEAERNSIKDLHAFIESGDKESAARKIEEVSYSIQLRKELVDSLERKNKWSIPLAVIGVIITIIFGIVSLF